MAEPMGASMQREVCVNPITNQPTIVAAPLAFETAPKPLKPARALSQTSAVGLAYIRYTPTPKQP
ncbi:uncharacterized protein P884DRAFT_23026 [Thermothelomyces heterothallicus CBS 202.75]|uniref:uncharacterized protein n=1 Tax=Thermothelomyces heterothallicus CBS 202.75 TaxID=1149848 RepID=UPI0037437B81